MIVNRFGQRDPRPPFGAWLLLLGCLAGCTFGGRGPAPAATLERTRPDVVRSRHGVVVAGSAGAADAGVATLDAGGNAVDAAVAAAFALGASDPGASGPGGATWLLIRFPDGRALSIDGSPPAPMAIRPEVVGRLAADDRFHGRATAAVPTTVAVLAHALDRHGSLPFAQVLEPAIALAESGYLIGASEHGFVADYAGKLAASPVLGPPLLRDGRAVPVGTRVVLPNLARTLRRLAAAGPADFYTGELARAIESDMAANGGFVRRSDLAFVKVREEEPVRGSYRGLEVLSAPQRNGGAAVVLGLEILERFSPRLLAAATADRHRVLVESVRWAMEGVEREPPAVSPALLVPGIRAQRADEAARRIRRREPPPLPAGTGSSRRDGNTTHLVVVDRDGMVVSLTQTLGRYWGSCTAAAELGFPYNCLLEEAGPDRLRPRAVAPAAVAPTIVTDADGRLVIALGSSGSERILSAILNCVVHRVDRGLPLAEAVAAPRVLWDRERRVCLELDPPLVRRRHVEALAALGYRESFLLLPDPRPIDAAYFGGVAAAGRDRDGALVAVADGRRDGAARGARPSADD